MSAYADLFREIAWSLPKKILTVEEIQQLEEGTYVMVMWPGETAKSLHVILRRDDPDKPEENRVFAVPWAYHLPRRSFDNEITGKGYHKTIGRGVYDIKVWPVQQAKEPPMPEKKEEEVVFASIIW